MGRFGRNLPRADVVVDTITGTASADVCTDPVVVVCSCGRAWKLSEWRVLPLAGYQPIPGEPRLELRHCVCRSTRAIAVDDAGNYVPTEAAPC